MDGPHLRAIDLNLLPILEALLEEQSVTLASARINLSQSATSTALGRLRETFEDPIVVRKGQRMEPSPKALLVQEELRTALKSISTIVQTFRGRRLDDRVSLALSAPEHVHLTLSKFVRSLFKDNKHDIALKIDSFNREDLIRRIMRSEVDIAIGAFGRLDPNIRRQPLYREKMTIILREGHPLNENGTAAPISLAEFRSFPHLLISSSSDPENAFQSRWLASKSIKRKIGATVSSVAMVPELLKSTDMICLGTERGVKSLPFGKSRPVTRPIPEELGDDTYPIEMIWHNRADKDPALIEIRERLREMTADV